MASTMTDRGGFSMVEMLVAIVILTFGLLALASATGYTTMQIRTAGLHTERAAAQQRGLERLYTYPYESIPVRAYDDALTFGDYKIWWDTTTLGQWGVKQVNLYSEGPAHRQRRIQPDVRDTMQVRIVRPYP
jgi:prepilin-type N-terminal cleavage/methylation domain-containing protein